MIPGAVTVAYLHPGRVSTHFSDSLTQLLFHDATRGEPRIVTHDFGVIAKNTPPTGLVANRNYVAKTMCDNSPAEWLLMVDSDMAFSPEIVDQLVAVADATERPVVGALAFAQKTDGKSSELGGVRYRAVPTIYTWHESDKEVGFVPTFDYPRGELVEVSATGAACLLVHRSVLERLRAKYGDVWFDLIRHPKHPVEFSEDMSFCVRLAAMDIPLHVHTGIKTGHDKGSQFLDEEFFDRERGKGRADVAGTIDIIIPTYGRPERLAAVYQSIERATVNVHRTVFVVEVDDLESIAAVEALGLTPCINQRKRNYAGAMNTALAESTADWVFTGADDLEFHEGWDTELLSKCDDWFSVIGTNDMFNGAVLRGTHSTHSLVRRRWLEQVGGVIDEGPGSFLFEGYDHNYVDTELVATAKMHSRFRPCLTSIVEHRHYLNGKAAKDATYERGMAHYDEDAALFESRSHLWALTVR